MNKNQIGTSNLYVSDRSLGCMSLGTDESKAKEVINFALDQGVNYLDTADLYDFGKNEEIVGKAVKGKRDQVIIGTKGGNHFSLDKNDWFWDPSKEYIKKAAKESLRRLGLDYIDLYQLHGGTIDDPIDETIAAFEELKSEGLIRYYGISSIRPNVIKEYIERSSIVSVMIQYSLLDRRPEEEILDLLSEHNISAIVRGPLAKGLLSDKGKQILEDKGQNGYLDYSKQEVYEIINHLETVARQAGMRPGEISLQYVLTHPAIATAVFGASTLEQIESNLTSQDSSTLTETLYQQLRTSFRSNIYNKHR